ncbi:MAG: acyl carrier protein [Candidatus Nealsonbacteria bacterium]|nr:acyl carrier protein [Candidatus Nealsonbacteria bacterium]
MSVEQQFAALFEKNFQLDPGDFTEKLVPEDVMLWDSLGHMNMVGAVEETFGLEFEVDEITEMTSAGKILEMIRAKSAAD